MVQLLAQTIKDQLVLNKNISLISFLFISTFSFSQVVLENCGSQSTISINEGCQQVAIKLQTTQGLLYIPYSDESYDNNRLIWELYRGDQRIELDFTIPDLLFKNYEIGGEGVYKVVLTHQVYGGWLDNSI